MTLLQLIVLIVVVGVALWAINAYVPMQAGLKKLLNVLVIIVMCLLALEWFGILSWNPHHSLR